MNEEPASSMDKVARVRCRFVAIACTDIAHFHFARWKQIHSWLRSIAECDVTADRSNCEHLVIGKVFEERTIWCPHSELLLGQLGNDAKVAHLV